MKQKVVVNEKTNPKTYRHVIDKSKSDIKPVNFVFAKKDPNSTEKGSTSTQNKKSVSKPVKTNENDKRNIGLLSKKQLRKKISEVTNRQLAATAKRNRNGKVGINKENNYMYIPNAPRKVCLTMVTLIILLLIAGRVKRSLLFILSLTLGIDQYFINHRIPVSIVVVNGILFIHVKNTIVCTTTFMIHYLSLIKVQILVYLRMSINCMHLSFLMLTKQLLMEPLSGLQMSKSLLLL
jgi:hypothetical protein